MACYCCISQAYAYNITNSEFIFTLLSLLPFSFLLLLLFFFFFHFWLLFSSLDFAYSGISRSYFIPLTRSPIQLIFVLLFRISHTPLCVDFSGISKTCEPVSLIPLLTYVRMYSLHSNFVFSHSFSRCALSTSLLIYPFYGIVPCALSLFLLCSLIPARTHIHAHVHRVYRVHTHTIHSSHLHFYTPTGSLKLWCKQTPGMFRISRARWQQNIKCLFAALSLCSVYSVMYVRKQQPPLKMRATKSLALKSCRLPQMYLQSLCHVWNTHSHKNIHA